MMRTLRNLGAIALHLMANCRGDGPRDDHGRAPKDAPRTSEPSEGQDKPAAAPPAPTCSDTAPQASLAEASMERLVFRQLAVGALVYPPRRLTWVLHRGSKTARLDVLCQTGVDTPPTGMSITGGENDEHIWSAPALTRYTGTASGEGGKTYKLTLVGPVGNHACESMPAAVELSCRPEMIAVLRAGARLVVERRPPSSDRPPSHWEPPATDRVMATRCDFVREGDPPARIFRVLWPDWPLVFAAPTAAATGVEWAHENGDAVVQRGGYRWIPVAP